MASRYGQLDKIVKEECPKLIVEIGTWNGERAIQLMSTALGCSEEDIHYIGFDLFEDGTVEDDRVELNVKAHIPMSIVFDKLALFCGSNPRATFELHKGYTRNTLVESICADLAFIDGGHSVETIEWDFDKLKDSTVVVLDDYYSGPSCPDTTKFGCNRLVANLRDKAIMLPAKDPVRGGGFVSMFVVRKPLPLLL